MAASCVGISACDAAHQRVALRIQAIPNGGQQQQEEDVDADGLLSQHDRGPHGDRILEGEDAHAPAVHMTPALHLMLYAHLPAHQSMGMHAYQLVKQFQVQSTDLLHSAHQIRRADLRISQSRPLWSLHGWYASRIALSTAPILAKITR